MLVPSPPAKLPVVMESVAKKLLRLPIRKLTSCVAGLKEKRLRPRGKKGRGRRGCNILGKLQASNLKDPSIIRSYQADLEKERQVDAVNHDKEGRKNW